MKKSTLSRRKLLWSGAATTLAAGCATSKSDSPPSLVRLGYKSPNEKLNVGAIGAGGKGASDIGGLASENVIALCDVDWKNAGKTFERFPGAQQFKDFRVMLDKVKLDAVTVSTADHTHAVAAYWAMQRGIAVYVQKPLTHNIYEARLLRDAARKFKVATQMGNQGHSSENVRKFCEMIWSGVIGNVKEVHAWTDRPIWPQGIAGKLPEEAPREDLDWDLFLGPAQPRPFNKGYTPFKWRGWWEFGCGALGDMACHILDPANMALRLANPTSVECVMQEGRTDECFPNKSIVRLDFPAIQARPALSVYWYEGGLLPPRPEGIGEDVKLGDGKNGSLFIGDKGAITIATYGDNPRLLPEEKMVDYKFPEPTLTRSPGHYKDFIRACKGGEPACSNFEYASPFTEWVLLGSIAQRYDGKLLWDAEAMRFTNHEEASRRVKREYRKGWEI